MSTPATPAYAGLKVLDLSQGIAGPYCAAMLGQHGADVIKVEPPEGDWIRLVGGGREGMSALAIVNNVGKRSISIDATRAEGRDLILELARRADVVVENFRPGVMTRLGLDYATVAGVNPRVIYLSITGFGASGPYASKPATDSVLQALTGMAVVNKEPGGKPRRIALMVPDTATALYANQRVAAALYARDARLGGDGMGRHLEVALAECCAAFQAGPIVDDFLFAGQYKAPPTVPAGVFATADGHVVVAVLRDAMWRGLCRALERDDWLGEARYADAESRGRASDEINAAVAAAIAHRDTATWAARFEENDVLFAPVQDYAQFRSDPQIRHMGCFGEAVQAPYGRVPLPHAPGNSRAAAPPAAPRAGEHTHAILEEIGVGAEDAERLIASGIVAALPRS